MKIQGKILICLIIVCAFLGGTIAVNFWATSRIALLHNRSLQVESELLAATALRAQVRNQLVETFESLFIPTPGGNEKIEQGKIEVNKKLENLEKIAEKNLASDATASSENQSRQFATDVEQAKQSYLLLQSELDRSVGLMHAGKTELAQAVLVSAKNDFFQKSFIKEITEVIENRTIQSRIKSHDLQMSIAGLKTVSTYLGISALVLSFAVAIFVSRSIGSRLKGLEKATSSISVGQLAISVDERGSDEIASLAKAMTQMATSLREAQSDLRKQQEILIATSRLSSLGEMAGGIAHEINNPLAVISMRVEQIKESCEQCDGISPLAIESCQIIIDTCDRIAKIISSLRIFARDGREDAFERADLKSIIDSTMSLCGQKFAQNGIKVEISLPTEPILFECRPTQISQILFNLLGNSFDAVADLKEKWVKISANIDNEFLEISVTDSGSGIPEPVRSKLSQPFFTTKEIGKGTGLGLSVSRGIAESHGGNFRLDPDSPNTRFVVTLKLAPKNVVIDPLA